MRKVTIVFYVDNPAGYTLDDEVQKLLERHLGEFLVNGHLEISSTEV